MHPITQYLLEHGSIDADEISWRKLPFSREQFRAWYNEHWHEDEAERVEGCFPTWKMPLRVDGHEFVVEVMIGQGSSIIVFTAEEWKKRQTNPPI